MDPDHAITPTINLNDRYTMSLFDAASFLSQTLDEANATKSIPPPQILAVPAQLVDMNIVTGEVKEGDNKGQTWYRLEWKVEITDQEYLQKWAKLGIEADKCTLRDSFFLQVNEGGGIAMGPGKNVQLGRLREATGTNKPGLPLNAGVGKMLRVDVKHIPSEKTGDPYAAPANPVLY